MKKYNISEIIRLYTDDFLSYKEIGDSIGVSPSTVKRILKKNNIRLRTSKETKNLKRKKYGVNWRMMLPVDEIRYMVEEEKKSSVEIASYFGCSSDYIRNVCRDNDISFPSTSEIFKQQYKNGRKVNCKIYDIPPKEDIDFLYNEKKLSLNKISKIFEVSIHTLKKWMIDYGMEIRNIRDSVKNAVDTGILKTHMNDVEFQRLCHSRRKKYNKSKGELELLDTINAHYDGVVKSSYMIGNKNFDIYIPEKNVAIEYNGLYWHSELIIDKNYHADKTKICNDNGIRLIHVWEDDWIFDRERTSTWLLGIIGILPRIKIYGRNTKVIEISPEESRSLFENYHIQGFIHSSVAIGLYYDNILIGSCLFTKYGDSWNLVRYVIHPKYMVLGGFRKMLKFFVSNYKGDIYTFADLCWVNRNDNVYIRSGFVEDKLLVPDYKYIYNKRRFHKFRFRHKYLKKMLKNYDPNISEYDNCLNNGIYRIYDCGKVKYKFSHYK